MPRITAQSPRVYPRSYPRPCIPSIPRRISHFSCWEIWHCTMWLSVGGPTLIHLCQMSSTIVLIMPNPATIYTESCLKWHIYVKTRPTCDIFMPNLIPKWQIYVQTHPQMTYFAKSHSTRHKGSDIYPCFGRFLAKVLKSIHLFADFCPIHLRSDGLGLTSQN